MFQYGWGEKKKMENRFKIINKFKTNYYGGYSCKCYMHFDAQILAFITRKNKMMNHISLCTLNLLSRVLCLGVPNILSEHEMVCTCMMGSYTFNN